MSEVKHTPGPWKHVVEWAGNNGSTVYVTNEFLDEVCTMASGSKTDLDNARLIAAAPDMLEALEAVWSDYDQRCILGRPIDVAEIEAMTKVRNSIDKAKGLTQPNTEDEERGYAASREQLVEYALSPSAELGVLRNLVIMKLGVVTDEALAALQPPEPKND